LDYFNSLPLYAEDSYVREFRAEVVKAGPRFAVLNRTAFYQESGGQPSDTGVLRVGDISAGSEVEGVIDWGKRYWNMRRHSAEHLLTGLFEEAGSGPKVYSDMERLEFKPSSLDAETLERVRSRFDEIVDENTSVRIYFTSREELDVGGDERKRAFLKKIPRNIERLRMVDISGHALTFCFGTHVRSTGEMGRLSELTLSEAKKGRKIVHFTLENA